MVQEKTLVEELVDRLTNSPYILMLQGLPASGKTTIAKQLVELGNVTRVNKDDLRAMLHGGVFSKENEREVLKARDNIIEESLRAGRAVVVDDTNFAPKHEATLRDIADKFEVPFVKHFVDTPVDECLRRNGLREDPVPSKVIRGMYNRYVIPMTPPDLGIVTTEQEEKDEAIIVDVDGTLAHMVDRNPYDASRAMEDIVDDATSVITGMAYSHGYKVIILTGRSAEHRQVTEDWLEDNGIPYDEIYTRADGDRRDDAVVKEELYRTHVEPRFKVKFVLDDRNRVVDMWRRIGLKCLQVDYGDF